MKTACTNISRGILISRSMDFFLSFSPCGIRHCWPWFSFWSFLLLPLYSAFADSSSFLHIQCQWSWRFWPQPFNSLLVSIFSLNEFIQVLMLQLALPYWKLPVSSSLTLLLNPAKCINSTPPFGDLPGKSKVHVWIHCYLFRTTRPILLASFFFNSNFMIPLSNSPSSKLECLDFFLLLTLYT